jgi:hypothetical protein
MLIWILDQRIFRRKPKPATTLNQTPLFSKYNSGFTYVAPAPKKNFKTYRRILKDSIAGIKDTFRISNRAVNRYDILPIKKWYSMILELMRNSYQSKGTV